MIHTLTPKVTPWRKRSDCAAPARFCHSVRFGVNSVSLCNSLKALPCGLSLTPRCTSSLTHLHSPLFSSFILCSPLPLSVTSWNRKAVSRVLSKDPTCTTVALFFHASRDYLNYTRLCMCTYLFSSSLTAFMAHFFFFYTQYVMSSVSVGWLCYCYFSSILS